MFVLISCANIVAFAYSYMATISINDNNKRNSIGFDSVFGTIHVLFSKHKQKQTTLNSSIVSYRKYKNEFCERLGLLTEATLFQ